MTSPGSLPSFEWARNGDPLAAAASAAGVSTRRWATRIRRCTIWRLPTALPATIDNAKPKPKDKRYGPTDGGGLVLEVMPSGSKP